MVQVGVVVLVGLFLFRGFFLGRVPIPLDALVGVYHPWADHFWGFVAGVPYKNVSLTDVFSQDFPWRSAMVDIWRHLQVPLWNPFSFAGYPLAANWQSAPFFPLNILMLAFGNVTGYGLIVMLQPILAMLFMLLFLREIKISRAGCLIGAVSFALGGFMMTYLEYATVGYILGLIPLCLFLIEKFLSSGKRRYMLGLAGGIFLILTAGWFQAAFYALLIIFSYAFLAAYRRSNRRLSPLIIEIIIWLILGIGLAGIQLGPVAEFFSLSIRNLDHNISEYNYGLLPLKSLITLLAPDFFGNPATLNYFGAIQYQEASGYFGILGMILAGASFFVAKKKRRQIYFAILLVVSVVLAFENPVSRLVYQLKLPLISTGYASRWLMPGAFAGAVLAAMGFDLVKKQKKMLVGLVFLLALAGTGLLLKLGYINKDGWQAMVSMRNLILPLALTAAGLVAMVFGGKKIAVILICALVIFDLVRYTVKFTPMAEKTYGTTEIPFLVNMKKLAGINRVAIDTGPIMPANTWMYAGLYTISGYDPLLYKDYGIWFRAINIGVNPLRAVDGSLGKGEMTRYLNLDNPMSPLLDLAGVKYLLTLKKDAMGKYTSEGAVNPGFLTKYKYIDGYGATALLENTTAMPRVNLYYETETEPDDVKAMERLIAGFDFRHKLLLKEGGQIFEPDKNDTVSVSSYEANEVVIRAKTQNGAYLLLSDTDYPGWRAAINGKEAKIVRGDGIFRAVKLPAGEAVVRFWYWPKSFGLGMIATATSGLILLLLATASAVKKRF